jgi:hypothetical protein
MKFPRIIHPFDELHIFSLHLAVTKPIFLRYFKDIYIEVNTELSCYKCIKSYFVRRKNVAVIANHNGRR